MWTKREAEWERERLARERLMAEVRKAFAYTVTAFTVTYTILVSYKCPAIGEPIMETLWHNRLPLQQYDLLKTPLLLA